MYLFLYKQKSIIAYFTEEVCVLEENIERLDCRVIYDLLVILKPVKLK